MGAQETIGFIGIGFMGQGMAANMLKKGYPLTFLGRAKRAPADALASLGGVEVRTPAEVAQRSSIVFLCVTGSREVENIVEGPNGLKSAVKPGTIVVDCSTSDPTSTVRLAALLAGAGAAFADAPLGGTPADAEAARLSTMVGATPETYERLVPVLQTWAAKSVRIGDVGDGHRMKLLNNFLSLGYGALYAEALTLAQKVGITPQRFDSVIRGGRMDCGFYQTFMRYTLEGDREAHKFSLANALKDTRYLAAMADAAGVANPVGAAVKNSYALAVAQGRGEDFVPTLAEFVARANGVELE